MQFPQRIGRKKLETLLKEISLAGIPYEMFRQSPSPVAQLTDDLHDAHYVIIRPQESPDWIRYFRVEQGWWQRHS